MDPAGENDAPANRGGVVCPPDTRDAVPYDMNEIMECWAVDRARKSGLAITHAVPAWSDWMPRPVRDPTKHVW